LGLTRFDQDLHLQILECFLLFRLFHTVLFGDDWNGIRFLPFLILGNARALHDPKNCDDDN
jgi:hypothetical protein